MTLFNYYVIRTGSLLLLTVCLMASGYQANAGVFDGIGHTPVIPVTSLKLPELKQPANLQASLIFIENKGQVRDQAGKQRPDIDFRLAAAPGLNIFIGKGKIHYQWSKTNDKEQLTVENDGSLLIHSSPLTMYRMDLTLAGANKKAKVSTEAAQGYYEHYYLPGSGAAGMSAASARKIIYHDIYPHIDWVLYINDQNRLEYDFVVRPGGRVSDIKISFAGASDLQLNGDGSFTARTPMGSITEAAPYSYQQPDKAFIPSRFVLKRDTLGFHTAGHSGTLVIDPKVEWASYYGGAGNERSMDIAWHGGSLYITGLTDGVSNIVTSNAYQVTYGGGSSDVFIAKFNEAGQRQWATFYGGSGDEGDISYYTKLVHLACDNAGNVYVTGRTKSDSVIATTGSHQDTLGGGYDAFIIKMDAAGSRIWSSYYGGSLDDYGADVYCDNKNNVYLSGLTRSVSGIATQGAHQNVIGSTTQPDAFLVKFNGNGQRLWATYYGDKGIESDGALTGDQDGNVYLVGSTVSGTRNSSSIATTGSYYWENGHTSQNAFLAKFDETGNRIWGTYFGRRCASTWGYDVVCDPYGFIYIAGKISGTCNFDDWSVTTPGSHQPLHRTGWSDGFLAKFDGNGQRIWGTYYGGVQDENNQSVTCDRSGNVYLSGRTSSATDTLTSIATPGAPQDTLGNGLRESYNISFVGGQVVIDTVYVQSEAGFLVKFDSAGVRKWGTYYGGYGTDNDCIVSAVCGAYDDIYTTGNTYSPVSISTPGSHQSQFGGGVDAFLVKYDDCRQPDAQITYSTPVAFCAGDSVFLVANDHSGYNYQWLHNGNPIAGATDTVYQTGNTGEYTVLITRGTCVDTADVVAVVVHPLPVPEITADGDELKTDQYYDSYRWFRDGQLIQGAVDPSYSIIQKGAYTVEVIDTNGCTGMSVPHDHIPLTVGKDKPIKTISVYPNPAHEIIHISAPQGYYVSVTSSTGQVVVKQAPPGAININGWADGIYLLQVTGPDHIPVHMEKIVKSAQR